MVCESHHTKARLSFHIVLIFYFYFLSFLGFITFIQLTNGHHQNTALSATELVEPRISAPGGSTSHPGASEANGEFPRHRISHTLEASERQKMMSWSLYYRW
jgi:hypothetical protein